MAITQFGVCCQKCTDITEELNLIEVRIATTCQGAHLVPLPILATA